MKVIETECLVIGAGPGGYTAAFYAADKGLKTTLVERYANLGGVCLNVGCIPSKALLHLAGLREEIQAYEKLGMGMKDFTVNVEKTRAHKEKIVTKLVGGVAQLAKMRKVNVVQGNAQFIDGNNLIAKDDKGNETRIVFNHAIVATGSRPIIPQSLKIDNPRVMTSTGALRMEDIPKKLLVIGGGVIGLELGFVYAAMGSEVSVVEALPQIGLGIDRDVFMPLERKLKGLFASIQTKTTVTSLKANGTKSITATLQAAGEDKGKDATFDRVLVSVGRRPNSDLLAVDKAGIRVDERGFIAVDKQMRTSIPNIYAIGDIVGNPMLAHKASREGHIAVEAILGKKSVFDNMVIPSVIYTDPEVAWAGLTETEAKEKNIPYKSGTFAWAASGRALALSKTAGLTKILFEPETERILGVAMSGANAGELIAEGVLAIEMGAVITDITETIHAHPTLSETFMEAAEAGHGFATHYYSPKRK